MARAFEALSRTHLGSLVGPCRGCVAWQLDPTAAARSSLDEQAALELKGDWLDAVRAEHGGAGWAVLVDGEPAGHVVYAPAVTVPRVDAFPTAPVAADALVLVALWASHPTLYKPLVQRAVKDLRAREVAGLEAFAGGAAPRGCQTSPAVGTLPCRFPQPLLERLGFRPVREHPVTPRYRIEVGAAIQVLDQLESGVTGIARALRPGRGSEPGLSGRTGRTAHER